MHTVQPMPQNQRAACSKLPLLPILVHSPAWCQQWCLPPESPPSLVKDSTAHTPALPPCLLFALQPWLNKEPPVMHFYQHYRLYSQILLKNILHCGIKSSIFTQHTLSLNRLLYHVLLQICQFVNCCLDPTVIITNYTGLLYHTQEHISCKEEKRCSQLFRFTYPLEVVYWFLPNIIFQYVGTDSK